MHILAIANSGGEILGNRPLALDELEAFEFIYGDVIQKGYTPIRKWRKEDNNTLPTFSWWGYGVITEVANRHFCEKP